MRTSIGGAGAAAVLVVALLSACTTASYGRKPEPVEGQQDTFTFPIYTGGFSGEGTADKRAEKELEKFKAANGYKSCDTIKKDYKFLPSGFTYTVKCSR